MNIGKTLVLAGLTALTLAAWAPVHAQDVFQTGETQRTYNYVQAQYVLDQDEIDYPFIFTLQVSATPSFAFRAEYLNLSLSQAFTDSNGNPFTVKAEAKGLAAGLNYHRASERWPRIDWTAGLGYQRIETDYIQVTTGANVPLLEEVSTAFFATIGVRAAILANLEAEAEVYSTYADGEITDTTLDLTTVYRVADHIDLSLGADGVNDDPIYSVGVRYSW